MMSWRYRNILRRLMQVSVKHRSVPSIICKSYYTKNVAVPCTLGFSLFTLIGLEKKLSAEDELIETIKHCVLFMQRKEYDKAEQLLHVALRNAQQINHQLGVTYIYDVMANLALEREQYSKANQLFVAVTQRIMSDGAPEDDLRVIHISAKLARIKHLQKEHEVAQIGYDWCLQKLYNVFKINPTEEVSQLIAMTEDWYGRLFLDCNQDEQGLKLLTSAYDRMRELPSLDQEHVVIQLNDLGTVCHRIGKIDQSIDYFLQAIELCKQLPEMEELGALHVNLGRAYIKKNLIDEARKSCGYGWKLGVSVKNNDIKHEAEECLNEIKNAL